MWSGYQFIEYSVGQLIHSGSRNFNGFPKEMVVGSPVAFFRIRRCESVFEFEAFDSLLVEKRIYT